MKYKTSEVAGGWLNAAVAKALCVGDKVATAKYSHPVVIRSLDICILGYGMSDAKRKWWSEFEFPPSAGSLKTHPDWDQFFRERQFSPSTCWDVAGPIIERERVVTAWAGNDLWFAAISSTTGIDFGGDVSLRSKWESGTTPLIAAMRAFVAYKLGKEVEL